LWWTFSPLGNFLQNHHSSVLFSYFVQGCVCNYQEVCALLEIFWNIEECCDVVENNFSREPFYIIGIGCYWPHKSKIHKRSCLYIDGHILFHEMAWSCGVKNGWLRATYSIYGGKYHVQVQCSWEAHHWQWFYFCGVKVHCLSWKIYHIDGPIIKLLPSR